MIASRSIRIRIILGWSLLLLATSPAIAEWKAANADVSQASKEPRIAAVLSAINAVDAALVNDNQKVFATALADDLVVNNPQNQISLRGATRNRSAAGHISYSRYDRTIEYAGLRGEFVLLMGEERVTPKGENHDAGHQVRRRFTDLWKQQDGRWLLTARQATIIEVL